MPPPHKCPDVQVLFARGTDEPPGLGQVGDAFVSGLRDRTGRDIAAAAVNYPAHQDIGPGVADLSGQLDSIVKQCPNTRIIVGGYSLGAGVTNRVLNDPLPQAVSDHIAAVVLFGNASRLLDVPVAPGPEFAGKSIDVCNPGDPICSGGPLVLSHLQIAYVAGGGVNSAVEFAMGRI
ncbi:cutinase family protein [Mycobacterium sp. NPDC006124]|uniref:cutinase family protein n=1 Tax=Mycobacterium sp. NPDC006124 TaxID=3156729 RepID=UPI0033B88B0C